MKQEGKETVVYLGELELVIFGFNEEITKLETQTEDEKGSEC